MGQPKTMIQLPQTQHLDLGVLPMEQLRQRIQEAAVLSRSDRRVRSSSGISGFGDLGRDYEDGFRRRVVPKREIGHVKRHVTIGMTSEDYTSRDVTWNRARH